jgi:HSP20 family molecular chaperone IbpA
MLTPQKRRAPLRPIILGLILLGLLGWMFRGLQNCQAQQARTRIEQSLGNPSPQSLPQESPLSEFPSPSPDLLQDPERSPMGFPSMPANPFSELDSELGIDADGVKINEDADAYRIDVPLANKADANEVQVKVSPHHIEVSGQTGSSPKSQSGPGLSFTTSFMQSLDTSQEVLPQKVKRDLIERNGQSVLHVTIPKKSKSAAENKGLPSAKTFLMPSEQVRPSKAPSAQNLPDNVF